MTQKISVILVCACIACGCAQETRTCVSSESPDRARFANPVAADRPETWFHMIDGNVSSNGVTADLEAIAAAGISGIQFFHGGNGQGAWPGIEQGPVCLSPAWDDLVRHTALECRRLGLTFRMQNCPGWSMAGGPWITPDTAQRELFHTVLVVPAAEKDTALPPPPSFPAAQTWRDYRDIAVVRFPTPKGDDAASLPREGKFTAAATNVGDVVSFEGPVTVRTLVLPAPQSFSHNECYDPAFAVTLFADGKEVRTWEAPQSNWQDWERWTLAVPETTAKTFAVRLRPRHADFKPQGTFLLLGGARAHSWEGKSARCLRGLMRDSDVVDDPACYVSAAPDTEAETWTILRFGHAVAGRWNGPAPAAATGLECDKLSPRGIEANFAAYIGRLADGPLKGLLDGLILDSWECASQTWTPGLEKEFLKRYGYDPEKFFPALAGYVVESRARTDAFLLDWRHMISDLFEKNFWGRMRELGHAKGLTVDFETAAGDTFPGDILTYFKFADTPMCEFWNARVHPETDDGFVGSIEFKPIRPAASAARLYGQNCVAAESLTSMWVTWDEEFRNLKPILDYHLAAGVNHVIFHTYTHHPLPDTPPPGSAFFGFIGSPFMRTQTWWPAMRSFTDYIARCCYMLACGRSSKDVLLFLGDDQDHKPPQRLPFPPGYDYDYLNGDALRTRLDVEDGRFCVPEGTRWSVVWIRPDAYVSPESAARLAALEAKGGRVYRGADAEGAVAATGLPPDVSCLECGRPVPPSLRWAHRTAGDAEIYFFVNDSDEPFEDVVETRAGLEGEDWDPMTGRTEPARAVLALAPHASVFRVYRRGGDADACERPLQLGEKRCRAIAPDGPWSVSFSSLSGESFEAVLTNLVPWTELPLDEKCRAFSGTAVYRASFSVPAGACAGVLAFDDVKGTARVKLNGRDLGWTWGGPTRLSCGDALRSGSNDVEVTLYSPWRNRLIYEARHPAEHPAVWTFSPPGAENPYAPYGLVGRVMLEHD